MGLRRKKHEIVLLRFFAIINSIEFRDTVYNMNRALWMVGEGEKFNQLPNKQIYNHLLSHVDLVPHIRFGQDYFDGRSKCDLCSRLIKKYVRELGSSRHSGLQTFLRNEFNNLYVKFFGADERREAVFKVGIERK